jgi:hypothetical protein
VLYFVVTVKYVLINILYLDLFHSVICVTILLNVNDDHVKPLLVLHLCLLNDGPECYPYSRNLGENFKVNKCVNQKLRVLRSYKKNSMFIHHSAKS